MQAATADFHATIGKIQQLWEPFVTAAVVRTTARPCGASIAAMQRMRAVAVRWHG